MDGRALPSCLTTPCCESLVKVATVRFGSPGAPRELFFAVKVVERDATGDGREFARAFRGLRHYEPISRQDENLMDVLHVGPSDPESYFYSVMELADNAPAPTTADERRVAFPPRGIRSESDLWGPPDPRPIDPSTYRALTLRLHLERNGRLPPLECIELGLELCRALGGLHRHGLVHRDIKPSNIIFAGGRPKLADIDLVSPPESTLRRKVAEGYTPPEGAGSVRADLYSLGKVLYEISTGLDRTDFPTPPDRLPDGEVRVWADLNEVILRACKSNPDHRYSTARELHNELLLVRAGKPIRRLRLLESRFRTLVGGLAGLLVFAMLLMLAFIRERQLVDQLRNADSERRTSLIHLHMANGRQAMDSGLLHHAILWFTRALEFAEDRQQISDLRKRIGMLRGVAPKLVGMGFHEDLINEIAFSPEGSRFVTGSDDGTARVWDSATGNSIGEPMRHGSAINHVEFSPEGGRVVTAGYDGFARVWSVAPVPQQLLQLPHGTNVFIASFSPNGRSIVTAGAWGRVCLWDAGTGWKRWERTLHTEEVLWVEFSPDGRSLVTASRDQTAGVWDVETGDPRFRVLRHPGVTEFAEFSPDGRRLLTACRDGVLRFWSAESGLKESLEIRHHRLNHATFSHDGTMVVTSTGGAGEPSDVRVWNSQTGQPIGAPLRHDNRVRFSAFSPDDRWIATAGHDGQVLLASVGTPGAPIRLTLGDRTWALAFSPDNRRLLTAGREPIWRLWAIDAYESMDSPSASGAAWGGAAAGLGDDGKWLWAWSIERERLWKRQTNSFQLMLDSQWSEGRMIWIQDRFDRNAERYLHHRNDNRLEVLNLATLEPMGVPLPENPSLSSASLSVDGRFVFTGDGAGQVITWDVSSGRPVGNPVRTPFPRIGRIVNNHSGDTLFIVGIGPNLVSRGAALIHREIGGERLGWLREWPPRVTGSAVFSQDDATLWFGGGAGFRREPTEVAMVETRMDRERAAFPHPDNVGWLKLHPGGKILFTGGADGLVRSWGIHSGTEAGPPMHHESGVSWIATMPDGRRILSGTSDGSARIWAWANGEPLTPMLRHGAPLSVVESFDNGSRVLTATLFGELTLYDIAESEESFPFLLDRSEVEACRFVTRDGRSQVLSPEELRERWGRNPAPRTELRKIRFKN
jgi:WD40 repeat protein/serine/threonine protein kinase